MSPKPDHVHLHGEVEDVPDSRVIELHAGDAIVLSMPADTSTAQARTILDQWQERLPEYRVVLIAGADVYVMRNVEVTDG